MKRLFLTLICTMACAAQAQTVTTAMTGATLVNSDGSAPISNATVMMRDGRIVAFGPAGKVAIPKQARVIDTGGKWVVPGYVDSHVHFFQSGGLYTRPDGLDLRKVVPYEREVADIEAHLDDTFARYLASGITAVADVGGPMWNFTVRDRATTSPRAPRVAITGPLISTWKPPVLSDVADPPIVAATSPDQGRELVRRELPEKPDYIKIWYVVRKGETPQQFLPIVAAVIDEAHKHGMRVAVHATELETARAALKAGADILVHGVDDKPVDAGFIALLRERNAIYGTTLRVMGNYYRTFEQQLHFTPEEYALGNPTVMGTLFDLRQIPGDIVPARVRTMLDAQAPIREPTVLLHNLKAVQDAGVRIAVGTDAGNIGTLPGPSIYDEYAAMAAAGITPAQVLTDTTLHGAMLMGKEKALGSIATGKIADLVVLNSDPSTDVAHLHDIAYVVKGGRIFRQDELIPPTPTAVVQRQVNAYNARDIDAFLATYSADARLNGPDGKLMVERQAAMRTQYAKLFDANKALHVRIEKRRVAGDRVTDSEVVTGLANGKTVRATTTYKVTDGKIAEVSFAR
jgi:imidazolonepropionase-like amidohydrolase